MTRSDVRKWEMMKLKRREMEIKFNNELMTSWAFLQDDLIDLIESLKKIGGILDL